MHADQPHILVIDDDERIRSLVMKYLWKNEFMAVGASNTKEAEHLMTVCVVDALVVDIMMPGENGLEFTRHIRAKGNETPVILLTALGEIDDRISGFEQGADDYLAKPFEPQELVMRLKALLKRVPPKGETDKGAVIGTWIFNKEEATIQNRLEGSEIRLTELETQLLCALLKTPGQPVSREQLAQRCDMSGSERAIDVQVTRLRKKIEENPSNPRLLRTIRGKGYMIRDSGT